MTGAALIGAGIMVAALMARRRMPWPVDGPISSGFQTAERPDHNGVDIAVPIGTPVRAPRDAVVVDTYFDSVHGGGNSMRAILSNGLIAGFAHLSAYVAAPGQSVPQGGILALSGNSGTASTGPHLHYTLRRDGHLIDPESVSA